jgi:hypothetical protein
VEAMKVPVDIRDELRSLLKKIPNPNKVVFTPDLSNPVYKYYLNEDGTYRMDKRKYLSDGKLN